MYWEPMVVPHRVASAFILPLEGAASLAQWDIVTAPNDWVMVPGNYKDLVVWPLHDGKLF